VLLWAVGTIDVSPSTTAVPIGSSDLPPLAPTFHTPISRDAASLWLVPSPDVRQQLITAADPALKSGIRAHREGRHSEAIALLSTFEELRPHAVGEDEDLISLRLAECSFFRKRYRLARATLKPFVDRGPREAEARYFYASTLRELGLTSEYVRVARSLIDHHSGSAWAEDTLNDLATHYIRNDDDAAADAVLREPHLALAAYNAGDSRVTRWIAERADEELDQEVFIDDIPYPETQAYVRKILSTSEDYRRLYGDATTQASR
jgi:hypothetical protein